MEGMDWEEAFEPTYMGGGSRIPTGDLTRDHEQAIVGSFSYSSDTISPGNAAGRPLKRRGSLLDIIDGRDGKRTKSLDMGSVPGLFVACTVNHQLHRSVECACSPSLWKLSVLPFPWLDEVDSHNQELLAHQLGPTINRPLESQLPSSSGAPTDIARGGNLEHYGGRQYVQHFRSSELDGVEHKIFLSHSGAQKDFVEQLCVDLERGGFVSPFFDLRDHSMPKGKDFVPLIQEAARHCHVAVLVLSEEFLCSKWPMIELAEFHGAQQAGNQRLNMLPLFYKLSVEDLDERAIEERWMPTWRQLASDDERIDAAKWSDAVRAMRKVNGVVFGEKGLSEVAYRKDVVRSIFKLSPPDLMYGSSRSMVGYSRICETVCDRFVRGTSGGPSLLGLYGTSGVGKTTLCKALCDHFCGEYMGRVCHLELGETPRMGRPWHVDLNETRLRRVKLLLGRLCCLDKDALDRITDCGQGLEEMHTRMKREPVFLAFDNVTKDSSSWKEVREYLMAGFHRESRILMTSRSILNVCGLVRGIEFCMRMPKLSAMEAGELFLRSAAPSKSIFGLTAEERGIVGLCIQQCLLFEAGQDQSGSYSYCNEVGHPLKGDAHDARGKSYHPMALSALGDFFCRHFSNGHMLRWTNCLKENEGPLWDLWKLPDGIIGRIIGLQFYSLPPRERLLFLDVAFFTVVFRYSTVTVFYIKEFCYMWLCKVHEEARPVMERRLQDLERSGMITFDATQTGDGSPHIGVHDIYQRFAEWYVTNHGVKWLKGAQGVFQGARSTLDQDHVASDLVRLRMFDWTRASARLFANNTMHNLEVLQLHSCPDLTELDLEGLESLRELDLVKLRNLKAVTMTSSSPNRAETGGIFESLQIVILDCLDSLEHGPDVRSCTSLHGYYVARCPNMTNLDTLECPHMKALLLSELVAHQFARLPNVKALPSLEFLDFSCRCNITLSAVEASREAGLRDLGEPYLRVVEELFMYLRTERVAAHPSSSSGTSIIKWSKRNPLSEGLQWWDSSGECFEWK